MPHPLRLAYNYPRRFNSGPAATCLRDFVRRVAAPWEKRVTVTPYTKGGFMVYVDPTSADRVQKALAEEGFVITNGKGRGAWGDYQHGRDWCFIVDFPDTTGCLAAHMHPDAQRPAGGGS